MDDILLTSGVLREQNYNSKKNVSDDSELSVNMFSILSFRRNFSDFHMLNGLGHFVCARANQRRNEANNIHMPNARLP